MMAASSPNIKQLAKRFGVGKSNIKAYIKEFETIDGDMDGKITVDELKIGLATFGCVVTSAEAESMIEEANANKDDKIDLVEFLDMVTRAIKSTEPNSDQKTQQAFTPFGAVGVSVTELESVKAKLGQTLSEEASTQLSYSPDKNKVGHPSTELGHSSSDKEAVKLFDVNNERRMKLEDCHTRQIDISLAVKVQMTLEKGEGDSSASSLDDCIREVYPRLFIGCHSDAVNELELVRNNVSRVIRYCDNNGRDRRLLTPVPKDIRNFNMVFDSHRISEFFDYNRTVTTGIFRERAASMSNAVLITTTLGQNRCLAAVCAYLLTVGPCSWDVVNRYAKIVCPTTAIADGYQNALRIYDQGEDKLKLRRELRDKNAEYFDKECAEIQDKINWEFFEQRRKDQEAEKKRKEKEDEEKRKEKEKKNAKAKGKKPPPKP